ncbi:MAG: hypothetical protein OXI41_02785 [Chloroflexota bacterium]|nr:hypothetical protein [Chloroflexota bacterium]MDE2896078.1 hypothetical protein [Chloroflexota bacterium]
MATMNPVLRLRRAFRAMGADEEQAEEAAGAIDDEYVGREFFEARQNQQTAELRKEMAELRNQILIGALLIAALAVAVLTIVIAVFD